MKHYKSLIYILNNILFEDQITIILREISFQNVSAFFFMICD